MSWACALTTAATACRTASSSEVEIERCEEIVLLHDVAHIDLARDHAAKNAEAEDRAVTRLDRAGEDDSIAQSRLDDHREHGTDRLRCGRILLVAIGETIGGAGRRRDARSLSVSIVGDHGLARP